MQRLWLSLKPLDLRLHDFQITIVDFLFGVNYFQFRTSCADYSTDIFNLAVQAVPVCLIYSNRFI